LSPGSSLPPGLSLAGDGTIAGTPSAAGNQAFFVTVTDSAASAVQAALSITVQPPINNPPGPPTLTSVTPSSAQCGGSAMTIDVVGTGFQPTSQVLWDTTAFLATTYVSDTHLAAEVSVSLVGALGTHNVTVSTPPPGGGTSAAVFFTVNGNPVPTVSTVSPSDVPVSAVATQVTVTGTGFVSGSSVTVGSQTIPTVFSSSTSLVATVPASYLSSPRTVPLFVVNPPACGGYSPTSVGLSVGTPDPPPALSARSPALAFVGDATFALNLTGTGLVSGGQIYFGPYPVPTTVNSATSAQATVDASLLTSPGNIGVAFANPPPGGTSNVVSFTIEPPKLPWVTISTGIWSSCGITNTKSVYCWGASLLGGSEVDLFPALATSTTFDAIAVADHACGLQSGQLYCWGANDRGQSGGTFSIPAPLFTGKTFTAVSAGRYHSCALDSAGALYCWGGDYGVPGASTNVIPGTYKALSASQDLVCALDMAGTAQCWSTGATAGFLNGSYGGPYTTISGHFLMACGARADGSAYCWGDNRNCTLGNGTSGTIETTPQQVLLPNGTLVADIKTGCFSGAALTTTGAVYGWNTNATTPALVAGIPPMASISVSQGGGYTCALSTAGERWCWGTNQSGTLGDGDLGGTGPHPVP
jgi:hypothetical protein